MFYLGKKNWFGSKHTIVSEQFLFVTETSQTAASFPKQKKKKKQKKKHQRSCYFTGCTAIRWMFCLEIF